MKQLFNNLHDNSIYLIVESVSFVLRDLSPIKPQENYWNYKFKGIIYILPSYEGNI